MAVSRKGVFAKPKTLPESEPRFSLTFTYGFAIVADAEKEDIEQLEKLPDLAERLWELQNTNQDVLATTVKNFSIPDKSIYHVPDAKVTLSRLAKLCDVDEENYKKLLPRLQENAAQAQWETRSHKGKTPNIVYCFNLKVTNSVGDSYDFHDFDVLREFIKDQKKPAPASARKHGR